MDWDEHLFAVLDDLEGQAEALYDAERAGELADRSRAAYAEVSLASRLMASVGGAVVLHLLGVGPVPGELHRVGNGWCLLRRTDTETDWVVRLAAVAAVAGASDRSVPEVAWSPVTRLGFGSALRRIADSGEGCVVHATDGAVRDVALTRVGADFVEATGAAGQVLLLAHDQIAAVQTRP